MTAPQGERSRAFSVMDITHEQALGHARAAISHACNPRNLRTAADVTAAAQLIDAYRGLLDEECWANTRASEDGPPGT